MARELRKAGLTSWDLLTGSFAHGTQARPLHRVEVVVGLALPHGGRRASAALDTIANVLASNRGVGEVRIGAHHVDALAAADGLCTRVIPARLLRTVAGLLVPCVVPRLSIDDWSYRNPVRSLEAAEAYENDTGGVYSMTGRLLNAWNRCASSEQGMLTSDHIEAILWQCLRLRLTAPVSEALETFFEEAYWRLDPGARTPAPGWRITSRFPATIRENVVDDTLSEGRRRRARVRVSRAREQIREARATADPAAAASIWRCLLTACDSDKPLEGDVDDWQ